MINSNAIFSGSYCDYNEIVNNLERSLLPFLPKVLSSSLRKLSQEFLHNLEEIRLRADKPVVLCTGEGQFFIGNNGELQRHSLNTIILSSIDIHKALEMMCEFSVYAFEEDIKNGFLTLKGGHRIGISGRTVTEKGIIKTIKDISSLNIRISKEILGCAGKVIKYIIRDRKSIYNTLLISPPKCGKTTMLRDITRILGDGNRELGFDAIKVSLIDERSEIAACYKGVPQNHVGYSTDVLDACPKQEGMLMMLRSMSPQVIVTDEIGSTGDYEAILKIYNAGVSLITSAHGYNISEMKSRQEVLRLIESNFFDRFIVLDNSKGPGTIKEIVDGNTMEVIYKCL